jgi:hypothetical protein
MRDDDDSEWLPSMGHRGGNLLFSAGVAGAARRTQTDHLPAVRIYLAGLTFARALRNLALRII